MKKMPRIKPSEIETIKAELSPWSGYLGIKNTKAYVEFLNRPEKVIAFFTGNQWGKNVNIIKQYIRRWRGEHPVEWKNLGPSGGIRTYRFCSEKKPNDPDGGDSNTVYPVLKRMIPKWMIVKDINQRRDTMTLRHPKGGEDFYVEFISYGQDIQVTAGQQRCSVYIDENCSRPFFEEQIPRILASDGDIIIGMTPALGQVTWQYEDIFEKANVIYRTKRVRDRLKEAHDEDHQEIEITANNTEPSICVFQCATDDNPDYKRIVAERNKRDMEMVKNGKHPVYKSEEDFKPITVADYINESLGFYDEETEDVRRYGIFRQVSGRIYKDFDTRIHVIDERKYFPDDVPHQWMHGRGIDYHQHVPWHGTFIAISPDDEAFVYEEVVMSPERYVTAQICREIVNKSQDYRYQVNRIDPLSAQTQTNTGVSTLDDVNRVFSELKREGMGTGGYWSTWDTKSTRGREEVRKRIKNARMCGQPFNNKQFVNGKLRNIPTIWFFSNCRVTVDSMKNWRMEEWSDRSKLETKEQKETPMQKNSHICMAIECLFKESSFRARPASAAETWAWAKAKAEGRHTGRQYGGRR